MQPRHAPLTAPTTAPMLVLACLALLFGSCGGSGGGDAEIPAGPTVAADFYVRAGTGSDANPGTWEAPFQTITHALTVATSGERIHALPGAYNAGNGETFPLVVPAGVELVGDEPAKGIGTIPTGIYGGGPAPAATTLNLEAAVFLEDGAVLAGFAVIDPNPYTTQQIYGVSVLESNAWIRNCYVQDSLSGGISFHKSTTGGGVTGCVVGRCGIGLFFAYGPSGGKVEDNVVTQCTTGVECRYAEPDLGGGAAGSLGGNVLVQNTGRDLFLGSGRTISAQTCSWDAAPPNVVIGAGGGGIDVNLADGTASADTTGAVVNTDTFTIPLL